MSAGRLKPKNDRDFIFIDEPRDQRKKTFVFQRAADLADFSDVVSTRKRPESRAARRTRRDRLRTRAPRGAEREDNHPNPMRSTLLTSCS
jgi:hypothetical protein